MLETLLCCRTRVTCGMRIGSAPCCPSTCNPLRYFSICRLASRTNDRLGVVVAFAPEERTFAALHC